MDEASINPRWLCSVVRDRGLPAIELDAVIAGLSLVRQEQLVEMRALIGRVHSGAEKGNDMEMLSDWIRSAKSARSNRQVLMPDAIVAPVASAQESVGSAKPHRKNKGSDVHDSRDREQWLHPAQKALDRLSHHVYGSSADCCFEPTVIEDVVGERMRPPFHTISIEIAPIVGGTKSYAWEKKIAVRLTKRELPSYTAVMVGYLAQFQASKHGSAHDKSIDIQDQGAHIFVKLRQGPKILGVQASPDDVFVLAAMALEANRRNSPALDSQTVLHNLKRYADMVSITTRMT